MYICFAHSVVLFIWNNVNTPTLNTPTVITPTLITPTIIIPTLITPTIITPTLNTSTVTDSLCNSGAFSNPNAVRDCPFNLKGAWFSSRSRKFFSYAALLFLKLFSAAFHVVILQRDTKGWYSRKCIIIKRTLLLVSSAEEQDEIEMSERKKNHLQYIQTN